MDLKSLKQKKLFLFVGIPAIIVVVVTAFYWGAGGFNHQPQAVPQGQGINTKLPSPHIDDKNPLDKLSIYMQAEKDSAEKAQQRIRDPFFKSLQDSTFPLTDHSLAVNAKPSSVATVPWQTAQRNNEAVLQQKLKELQQQLDNNTVTLSSKAPDKLSLNNLSSEYPTTTTRYQEPSAPDPELMQIDSMLNKILDIQHPQRIAEKFSGPVTKDDIKSFFVSNRSAADSLLWRTDGIVDPTPYPFSMHNRFYELDDGSAEDTTNVIAATIYGTQVVTSGMTVTVRLDQDIYLANQTIPAGTLVWGEGRLVQDRFMASIKNITHGHAFFPVNMEVYSLDGLPGVPISGAMSQQAAKQGMDRGVQGLQISSLNPSLAAQAASAGIESAKSFLSKKARLIKVTLKDGHPILLRNAANGK